MLDPLFSLTAQNQRLQENTQRSSAGLQSQATKLTKTKPRKGRIDTSELSSDLTDMNGDMLGDMDPDMFGRGGGASLFKQMWEESVEGEEPEPEAPESLFDEGQGSCLIDRKKQEPTNAELALETEPGVSEDDEEASEEPDSQPALADSEAVEACESSESGEDVAEEEAYELEENSEACQEPKQPAEPEAVESEQQASIRGGEATENMALAPGRNEGDVILPLESLAVEEQEVPQAGEQPKEGAGNSGRASAAAGPDYAAGAVKLDASSPETQVLEHPPKLELPECPEPQITIEPDGTPTISWGLGSLLDNTEGFIFHEASLVVEESQEPSEAEADPAPKVPEELEGVVRVLIQGDESSPSWSRLALLLGRFGLGILTFCARSGVRVCLLGHGEMSNYPAIRNMEGGVSSRLGAGAYIPEAHICIVAEDALIGPPQGFHPALFYFAQAWDHVLGDNDFASLHSPAVKVSFEACRTNVDGHMFADGMSGLSPVHYFAQAVEAYLSENDCVNPLWTREDLYDFDRSMFNYVEYLFKQGNRS